MADAMAKAEQADAEEEAGAEYFRVGTAAEPAQVYSVRIPVDRLDQLRRLAAERGLKPSALMREWVIERLEDELTHDAPTQQFDVYLSLGRGQTMAVQLLGALDDLDISRELVFNELRLGA